MGNVETRTMMFLLLCSVSVTDVSASSHLSLGVRGGQWVRYDFQETFTSGGERWQKMEFLSALGTTVTFHVTVSIPAGIEMDQTETIDLASGDDFQMVLFSVRAFIISADFKTGDSICLGTFGNRTIAGELTRAYAGANRRVVFSNFSQGGSQYTFYWDEQTGVLTEGTMVLGAAFKTVWVTDTNMWGADFNWWLAVIITTSIIISIACGIIISRKNVTGRLHKEK